MLGELPYITGLYERGRRELTPDDNLSVDGIKEMVLDARERLGEKHPKIAERITPQLLSIYFRYIRNLSLLDRRLTPDLYTLIVAAQQTAGDDFALALAETARSYPCARAGRRRRAGLRLGRARLARMGINQGELPVWGTGPMVSRLPGQALSWRTCELRPKPQKAEQTRWRQRWDPFGMCSWPPEDDRIESFHRHVRDQAKAILGADLARTEKFTTSVRDGIDIRETLRNWHTGDLYVKVVPPSRGSIEVVVFLFDLPADPEVYTNRTTWYAEHLEESTLAFYATDPMKNLVGPGIAQAEYGGALFIFPPRPIPDIWTDPRLDFTDTLEERLLAAAFLHSQDRHVAVVSPKIPPGSLAAAGPPVRPEDRPPAAQAVQRPAPRAAAHVPRPQRQAGPVVRGRLHSRHVIHGGPMPSALFAARLFGRDSAGSELPATEPFDAPKYGLATQDPQGLADRGARGGRPDLRGDHSPGRTSTARASRPASWHWRRRAWTSIAPGSTRAPRGTGGRAASWPRTGSSRTPAASGSRRSGSSIPMPAGSGAR